MTVQQYSSTQECRTPQLRKLWILSATAWACAANPHWNGCTIHLGCRNECWGLFQHCILSQTTFKPFLQGWGQVKSVTISYYSFPVSFWLPTGEMYEMQPDNKLSGKKKKKVIFCNIFSFFFSTFAVWINFCPCYFQASNLTWNTLKMHVKVKECVQTYKLGTGKIRAKRSM